MKYLTTENAKTTKGESLGYLTAILYLAPSTLSGRNVCSHASEGCILSCLNLAGMGAFGNVQDARIAKTKAFFASPKAFVEQPSTGTELPLDISGTVTVRSDDASTILSDTLVEATSSSLDNVEVATEYVMVHHHSSEGEVNVVFRDQVMVDEGHAEGGTPGRIYR